MKKQLLIFLLLVLVISNLFSQNNNLNISVSETYVYKPTENIEASANYNKAIDYSKQGDLETAIKYYYKAIELDSNYVDAYDNLGVIYRRLGKYNLAKECYKKSISIYPDGITAHQNLAIIHTLQNNKDSIVYEYEKIIEIDSNNPEGYFGLGNYYMNLYKFELAINYALKALEIYKENKSDYISDAQHLVGLIYFYDGDNKKAKKYLKRAKKGGAEIKVKILNELNLN